MSPEKMKNYPKEANGTKRRTVSVGGARMEKNVSNSVGNLHIIGKESGVLDKLRKRSGSVSGMQMIVRPNYCVQKCDVGKLVCIDGVQVGTLKYYGATQFREGTWCGIELDKPSGKNDGSVKGVRYFKCQMYRGVFVPSSKVSLVVRMNEDSNQYHGTQRLSSTTKPYIMDGGSDGDGDNETESDTGGNTDYHVRGVCNRMRQLSSPTVPLLKEQNDISEFCCFGPSRNIKIGISGMNAMKSNMCAMHESIVSSSEMLNPLRTPPKNNGKYSPDMASTPLNLTTADASNDGFNSSRITKSDDDTLKVIEKGKAINSAWSTSPKDDDSSKNYDSSKTNKSLPSKVLVAMRSYCPNSVPVKENQCDADFVGQNRPNSLALHLMSAAGSLDTNSDGGLIGVTTPELDGISSMHSVPTSASASAEALDDDSSLGLLTPGKIQEEAAANLKFSYDNLKIPSIDEVFDWEPSQSEEKTVTCRELKYKTKSASSGSLSKRCQQAPSCLKGTRSPSLKQPSAKNFSGIPFSSPSLPSKLGTTSKLKQSEDSSWKSYKFRDQPSVPFSSSSSSVGKLSFNELRAGPTSIPVKCSANPTGRKSTKASASPTARKGNGNKKNVQRFTSNKIRPKFTSSKILPKSSNIGTTAVNTINSNSRTNDKSKKEISNKLQNGILPNGMKHAPTSSLKNLCTSNKKPKESIGLGKPEHCDVIKSSSSALNKDARSKIIKKSIANDGQTQKTHLVANKNTAMKIPKGEKTLDGKRLGGKSTSDLIENGNKASVRGKGSTLKVGEAAVNGGRSPLTSPANKPSTVYKGEDKARESQKNSGVIVNGDVKRSQAVPQCICESKCPKHPNTCMKTEEEINGLEKLSSENKGLHKKLNHYKSSVARLEKEQDDLRSRHVEEISHVEIAAQSFAVCLQHYEKQNEYLESRLSQQRLHYIDKESQIKDSYERKIRIYEKQLERRGRGPKVTEPQSTTTSLILSNEEMLEKENESLCAVLELKHDEIRKLKKDLIGYENIRDELLRNESQMKSLLAKTEDLQAQITVCRRTCQDLRLENQEFKEENIHLKSINTNLSLKSEELSYIMSHSITQ